MGNGVQVSRLQFAGVPARRFMPFHSRREMWLGLALLVVALVVAVVLQLWTHNPFVWLLLFALLMASTATAILWAEPARFSLSGDAAAIFEYLDELMRAAPEYERAESATGEVVYLRKGNRRFADSRSYCALGVRGDAVEVRGSRDILRRLRFWGTRHFACMCQRELDSRLDE